MKPETAESLLYYMQERDYLTRFREATISFDVDRKEKSQIVFEVGNLYQTVTKYIDFYIVEEKLFKTSCARHLLQDEYQMILLEFAVPIMYLGYKPCMNGDSVVLLFLYGTQKIFTPFDVFGFCKTIKLAG